MTSSAASSASSTKEAEATTHSPTAGTDTTATSTSGPASVPATTSDGAATDAVTTGPTTTTAGSSSATTLATSTTPTKDAGAATATSNLLWECGVLEDQIQLDIAFVVDVSRSMFRSSAIAKALAQVQASVQHLETLPGTATLVNNQVALVVFSNEAVVTVPFTRNASAVVEYARFPRFDLVTLNGISMETYVPHSGNNAFEPVSGRYSGIQTKNGGRLAIGDTDFIAAVDRLDEMAGTNKDGRRADAQKLFVLLSDGKVPEHGSPAVSHAGCGHSHQHTQSTVWRECYRAKLLQHTQMRLARRCSRLVAIDIGVSSGSDRQTLAALSPGAAPAASGVHVSCSNLPDLLSVNLCQCTSLRWGCRDHCMVT